METNWGWAWMVTLWGEFITFLGKVITFGGCLSLKIGLCTISNPPKVLAWVSPPSFWHCQDFERYFYSHPSLSKGPCEFIKDPIDGQCNYFHMLERIHILVYNMSSVTNISGEACVSFQAWTDPCGQHFAFAQLGPDRQYRKAESSNSASLCASLVSINIFFHNQLCKKRSRMIFFFSHLHQCNVKNVKNDRRTPEVRSDKDISKISQRYLKDIPKISQRYPKDIPKIS